MHSNLIPILFDTLAHWAILGRRKCLWRQIPVVLAGIAFSFTAAHSDEVVVESFGGTRPSWRLVEEDCGIVMSRQERMREGQPVETTFETIQFRAGRGTKAYFRHDIEPAIVIRELAPSVWIRANQANIRLHALIVLPNTTAPDGNGPIQFLVDGPAYQDVGRWQKLSFADIEDDLVTLMERRSQIYRRGLGQIDTRDAFIAAMVLNGYAGPNATRIDVDDLAVTGYVPVHQNLRDPFSDPVGPSDGSLTPELVNPTPDSVTRAATFGNTLHVDGVPFFARAVIHRGESIGDLARLGFNTVVLDQPLTSSLSSEAREHGVYLVCEPPRSVPPDTAGMFAPVIAWNLGRELEIGDVDRVASTHKTLSESPAIPRRPHYGHIKSGLVELARVLDIVEFGRADAGTSLPPQTASAWMEAQFYRLPANTVAWTSLQTEYADTLRQQTRWLGPSGQAASMNPVQLKSSVFRQLAAGSRGIVFQSRDRLDAIDPLARKRGRMFQWLNHRLRPLEPWGAAGTRIGVERSSDPNRVATVIQTQRASLIIVQEIAAKQTLAPSGADSPVTLMLDYANSRGTVYQLSGQGLQPITQGRAGGNFRVRLPAPGPLTLLIVSEDRLALTHLTEALERGMHQTVMLRAECLADWRSSLAESIDAVEVIDERPIGAAESLKRANEQLTHARRMLLANDSHVADRVLDACEASLLQTHHLLQTRAMRTFANRLSNPLVLDPTWLPDHYKLAQEIAELRWSPNTLPAGDFESIDHLTSTGWVNRRGADSPYDSEVDLVEMGQARPGKALRLTVFRHGDQGHRFSDATPVWVSSPEIPVRRGDVFRIHGWVNVATDGEQAGEGLAIIESLGGVELAERFFNTDGWREFTLYRVATRDGTLQVTFALSAPGDALLDDVTVQVTRLSRPGMMP